jgi:hypothetical protein
LKTLLQIIFTLDVSFMQRPVPVVEFDQLSNLSSGFVYEYNTKILEDLAHNKALRKPVTRDATQGKQFDLISGVACRQ